MKNLLKRMMAAVLTASLLVAPAVPASAMTKKQVNSEITSQQKKVKKYKGQLPEAAQNDQDERNSYQGIAYNVYYPDPFILHDTYTDKYYHFADPTGLTITAPGGGTKTATGLAKIADTPTYDFYGTKCYEATVVTDPHRLTDLNTKIDSANKRISLLKKSKKEKMTIAPTTQLVIGEQQKVSYSLKYSTEAAGITKITWKSSKPSVVKVSKNGTLTALKAGVATVTAKLSVTGRTYKTTITVTAQ